MRYYDIFLDVLKNFMRKLNSVARPLEQQEVLTNRLTVWSWALLEISPVMQPLVNFLAFYGMRRFITAITKALHFSLSWTRPIHSISPSYLSKIHLNIIHIPTSLLRKFWKNRKCFQTLFLAFSNLSLTWCYKLAPGLPCLSQEILRTESRWNWFTVVLFGGLQYQRCRTLGLRHRGISCPVWANSHSTEVCLIYKIWFRRLSIESKGVRQCRIAATIFVLKSKCYLLSTG
jgi:hypothetical protein